MGDGVIGSPPAFGAVQSRFESESPSQHGSTARSARWVGVPPGLCMLPTAGEAMTVNVADVLGRQERDDLEFKRDFANRDQLRKAVCALSNDLPARGRGQLLIGIDKTGSPVGLSASDEELLDAVNLRDEGKILPPRC